MVMLYASLEPCSNILETKKFLKENRYGIIYMVE